MGYDFFLALCFGGIISKEKSEVRIMELNYDCFRQVLIVLEEKLVFQQEDPNDPYSFTFPMLSISEQMADKRLKDFSIIEVFYALHNLNQAGYIEGYFENTNDELSDCTVSDITFSGHMFLKNIRDDGVWKKVKAGLGRVGGASLSIVTDLALTYIRQQVGLP